MSDDEKYKNNRRIRECCVYGCKTNEGGQGDSHSLHRFPLRDKNLFEKWLRALRIRKPHKEMYVCSRHFKENDFFAGWLAVDAGKRRLKRGVIPSIDLPKVRKTIENQNIKVSNNSEEFAASLNLKPVKRKFQDSNGTQDQDGTDQQFNKKIETERTSSPVLSKRKNENFDIPTSDDSLLVLKRVGEIQEAPESQAKKKFEAQMQLKQMRHVKKMAINRMPKYDQNNAISPQLPKLPKYDHISALLHKSGTSPQKVTHKPNKLRVIGRENLMEPVQRVPPVVRQIRVVSKEELETIRQNPQMQLQRIKLLEPGLSQFQGPLHEGDPELELAPFIISAQTQEVIDVDNPQNTSTAKNLNVTSTIKSPNVSAQNVPPPLVIKRRSSQKQSNKTSNGKINDDLGEENDKELTQVEVFMSQTSKLFDHLVSDFEKLRKEDELITNGMQIDPKDDGNSIINDPAILSLERTVLRLETLVNQVAKDAVEIKPSSMVDNRLMPTLLNKEDKSVQVASSPTIRSKEFERIMNENKSLKNENKNLKIENVALKNQIAILEEELANPAKSQVLYLLQQPPYVVTSSSTAQQPQFVVNNSSINQQPQFVVTNGSTAQQPHIVVSNSSIAQQPQFVVTNGSIAQQPQINANNDLNK